MVCPRTDDTPQPIFTARRYRNVRFFSRQDFTARSYDVLLVIRKTRFGPDLSQPTVCAHPLNIIILQSYDSDCRNVTKSRQCYGDIVSSRLVSRFQRHPRRSVARRCRLVVRSASAVGLRGEQSRLDAHRRDVQLATGPPPLVGNHGHGQQVAASVRHHGGHAASKNKSNVSEFNAITS